MRLPSHPDFHLTYCTNIHPAEGWEAVLSSVRRYAPALRRRLAAASGFGVGLRLSAQDAAGLLAADNLREFRRFLDGEGLYVAIINGFPYGHFHGKPVKASVYAPDWRDPARVAYTLDLIAILQRLVPHGIDGGVSTAPLSYKPWMAVADGTAWETMTRNVVRVAEALVRAREDSGAMIHLDIEPEPDCSIENTAETLEFFERRLIPAGAPLLARALGIGEDAARAALLDHVRVCFDCCHFAVEFENAAEALDRLRAAGVKIGRVQLSSAIDVAVPAEPQASAAVSDRLRRFADTTYLHQVVERGDSGLRHYPDLPDALDSADATHDRNWRIHFHVPLFTAQYGSLGSTQQYVADVLRHVIATGATTHLEIETYTWDVLPADLKMDVVESIAREYEWVLQTCDAIPRAVRRESDPDDVGGAGGTGF